MRNIRLKLAYDGTDFVGWQVQPNGRTVQQVVETAITKLTGEQVSLTASGRTDSGVHAIGQVANFPTKSLIPCQKLRTGLQTFLPDDVMVYHVDEVDQDFHATYSAKQKRYRYVIANTRSPDPFVRRFAYRYGGPLDTDVMRDAGRVLLGKHDFRCFESHWPNRATSVRTIRELTIERRGGWSLWGEFDSTLVPAHPDGRFIWIDIVADGFLYNMVRSIAGTLLQVGRGRWDKADVRRILDGLDRSQAGETAPACGLYLVSVDYDESP